MYLSRLTFATLPGRTHEAEEKLKQLRDLVAKAGGRRPRVLRAHFASLGAPDLVFEEEAPDLPPGASWKTSPTTVSPGSGSRGPRTRKSVLAPPTTTTSQAVDRFTRDHSFTAPCSAASAAPRIRRGIVRATTAPLLRFVRRPSTRT
jgi:hypothetical protein